MSDNRYYNYGCPALMNDGRFITNYIRSSTFDQYIRNLNNIDSTHDFRQFVQNNGNNIINNMKAYYHKNNTCKVEGRCLPMNNNVLNDGGFSDNLNSKNNDENNNEDSDENKKSPWYEELLNDIYAKPSELDFMMTNSNILDNDNLDNMSHENNSHQAPMNNSHQAPMNNSHQAPMNNSHQTPMNNSQYNPKPYEKCTNTMCN